jgi:two-component SAPR family response regulator
MTKPGDLPATNWEEKYEKEHKLRQEVEGELSIVKTITIDASPEMRDAKAKIKELQDSLDRFKKENNDLYNKIADLTEALKSKDYFEKPDYKFLVNENHRLEQQYLEVLADNKKLALEIEDRVSRMRKSGM